MGDGNPFPHTKGDGEPFPVAVFEIRAAERQIGKMELGVADYDATQMGNLVELFAFGLTQSGVGTTLVPRPTKPTVPEFAFFFIKPEAYLPKEERFCVKASFLIGRRVSSVLIYDAKGTHSVEVRHPASNEIKFSGWDHGNARLAGWDHGNP